MKIRIDEKDTEVNMQNLSYPCIMIGVLGTLVLFYEDGKGVLLESEGIDSRYAAGKICTDFYMASFKPFHGILKVSFIS